MLHSSVIRIGPISRMPCALANGLCGRQASFSDETPFIGRITDLWEDEHEKRMMVQWFYRFVRSPVALHGRNGLPAVLMGQWCAGSSSEIHKGKKNSERKFDAKEVATRLPCRPQCIPVHRAT